MEMNSLSDFVFFRRFSRTQLLGFLDFLNWGVPPPLEVHFKRFSLSLSLMSMLNVASSSLSCLIGYVMQPWRVGAHYSTRTITKQIGLFHLKKRKTAISKRGNLVKSLRRNWLKLWINQQFHLWATPRITSTKPNIIVIVVKKNLKDHHTSIPI